MTLELTLSIYPPERLSIPITLNSDLLEKNNNSKKRVTKIVLFYDDKSFDTYEGN